MLFSNRTISLLFKTPIAKSPAAASAAASEPQCIELSSMSSRPRASSSSRPTMSRHRSSSYARASPYNTNVKPSSSPSAPTPSATRPRPWTRSSSLQVIASRGYASKTEKQELYSDEGGSTGAGTDDVAHTDAAFDGSKTNPKQAAEGIEKETGKDYTSRSPANEKYSQDKQGGQGGEDGGLPLGTSKSEAKK